MSKKVKKPAPDEAATEFHHLFWKARREHRRLKKNAIAGDPDHQAALTFARAQGWPWAESLLEASRLITATEGIRSLELLSACEPSVPDAYRGLWEFVRGIAYQEKREPEEAITAFRKALDDPNFDRPAYAWANLGRALRENDEVEEAILALRKALDDPNYDAPGFAWNSLGVALRAKGEVDEAIAAYRKAIDDPSYDPTGPAWNNLGNALHAKGEVDEAIAAYRKAIDDPKIDTPAKG